VVPVLSHDVYYPGQRGSVSEVALRHDNWVDCAVYVCGPDAMISDCMPRLVAAGIPVGRIHVEDYDADPYRASARAGTITSEATAR
jgi:NAD(P)H-flavin reductase